MKKILITILLLFFPVNLYAATLEVGSGYAYATIQAAVNAAVAGDTVLVYPGTYNESVRIPDGKQGTTTSPIVIKAQYPARKPLDGGAWADTSDKRSIINASGTPSADGTPSNGDDFGIYNECYCSSSRVGNIIIDGFYIQNATDSGIYFVNEFSIWIRNNVSINNGYNTTLGSENWGSYVINWGSNFLVQNNYAELSAASPLSTSLYAIGGANSVAEYNECYLTSSSSLGRCYYVTSTSIGFIFRYNYIHMDALAGSQYARFRDATGFSIINNYIQSTVSQTFMVVHENTDAGRIENHKINNNTFVYNQGVVSNYSILGLGFLNNSEVKNSIFYSGVNDTNSYGPGRAWTSPSYSVTIDSNVYYNLVSLVEPLLNGYTETNTQNLNPNINASTGCAASVNNDTYGANLDISSIPYRKCDGTSYPIATSGFGVPPSPPTSLRVQ